MEQIPQDTSRQILAAKEQYKTAIASASAPVTFNLSQMTAQATMGGYNAVASQQQRAAVEVQRQQGLQQLQTESNVFEKDVQKYGQQLATQQSTIAKNEKEMSDWKTAQRLIDKNKEYAAAGDTSVMSKIQKIKSGTAKPFEIKSELHTDKVYIAGTGWTDVPGKNYASENAFNTMLDKIKEGERANKELMNIGNEAKNKPIQYIIDLQNKIKEGRTFEKMMADYNLRQTKETSRNPLPQILQSVPFDTWAKEKGLGEKIPTTSLPQIFQSTSFNTWAQQKGLMNEIKPGITGASVLLPNKIYSTYTSFDKSIGGILPGGAPFSFFKKAPTPIPSKEISNIYNGISYTQSKTLAVDVNTGKTAMQLRDEAKAKGLDPYTVSTSTYNLEDHYFVLDSKGVWRDVGIYNPNNAKSAITGSTIIDTKYGGVSYPDKRLTSEDALSKLLYANKFAITASLAPVSIPFMRTFTKETMYDMSWRRWAKNEKEKKELGLEPFGLKTVTESIKALPKAYYAMGVTSQLESDLISKNLPGYTKVIEKLDKLNEEQIKNNENIVELKKEFKYQEAINKIETDRIKQVEIQYKKGEVLYDVYQKAFDIYQRGVKDFKNTADGLIKKSEELKSKSDTIASQSNTLMQDSNYKAIDNLVKERGEITNLNLEQAKLSKGFGKVYTAAAPMATEVLSYVVPPLRIAKGVQYISTGAYDVSDKRYLQGAAEIAGGAFAIWGGDIISAGLKTKTGQAVVNYLGQPVISIKPSTSITLGGSAIPATTYSLSATGQTGLGIATHAGFDITKGTILKYGFFTGLGALQAKSAYRSGSDIQSSLISGATLTATSLYAPPLYNWLTGPPVKTIYDIPKTEPYYKELKNTQTGLVWKGREVGFRKELAGTGTAPGTEQIREPINYLVTSETPTAGSGAVWYGKPQIALQKAYNYFGFKWTPKPILVTGSDLGKGYDIVAGFGKGKTYQISGGEATRKYDFVIKQLQKSGLSLTDAQKVLKSVPAQDYLSETRETIGLRTIDIGADNPITKVGKISKISNSVKGNILKDVITMKGETATYKLFNIAQAVDPITGKPLTLLSGDIFLSKFKPGEVYGKELGTVEAGKVAAAIHERLQAYANIKGLSTIKSFSTDIPYSKIPIVKAGSGVTTEYAIKSIGEGKILNLDKVSRTDKLLKKELGVDVIKYQGVSKEGNKLISQTKYINPTSRIDKVYDVVNTPTGEFKERLIATRIYEVDQATGKLSKGRIIVSNELTPAEQKFYNQQFKLKPITFDDFSLRKTQFETEQLTASENKININKYITDRDNKIILAPDVKSIDVTKERITQYFETPPANLKLEAGYKDAVIEVTKNGIVTKLPLKFYGKGGNFYIKDVTSPADPFMYDSGNLAVNPANRMLGKTPGMTEKQLKDIGDIYRTADTNFPKDKPHIIVQHKDLNYILQSGKNVKITFSQEGVPKNMNIKLNKNTGQVELLSGRNVVDPNSIIVKPFIETPVIKPSETSKIFYWMASDKGAMLHPVKPINKIMIDNKIVKYDTIKIISGIELSRPSLSPPNIIDIVSTKPSTKFRFEFTPISAPSISVGSHTTGTVYTYTSTGPKIYPVPPLYPSATSVPTTIPIASPVLTPTLTPVLTPTLTPEITPIIVPSASPVVSPVTSPIMEQVPTLTPITIPVITPVVVPTITPVPTIAIVPIQVPYQTPLPRIAWIPTFIPRKEEQKKKKPLKKTKGYEVEIRRKRKFQEAAPFAFATKETAISFGARKTLGEAAATFRIKPSTKPIREIRVEPVPVGKYFRAPKRPEGPDTFVQIKTRRIVSPGEKREISYAGVKARLGKKSSASGSTNYLKSKNNFNFKSKSKMKKAFK